MLFIHPSYSPCFPFQGGWNLPQLSTDKRWGFLSLTETAVVVKENKNWLKNFTLIKQLSPTFTKRFSANSNCRFHISPAAQSEQCRHYVSSRGERKASLGPWYKQQKGNEKIDIPCWCPPLKVITETDSQRSLKILLVGLNLHPRFSQIMEADIQGVMILFGFLMGALELWPFTRSEMMSRSLLTRWM